MAECNIFGEEMEKLPQRKNGQDGLPVPPFAVYNIGSGQPENLLDFVCILSEELVRAGVLPKNYNFEAHKKNWCPCSRAMWR